MLCSSRFPGLLHVYSSPPSSIWFSCSDYNLSSYLLLSNRVSLVFSHNVFSSFCPCRFPNSPHKLFSSLMLPPHVFFWIPSNIFFTSPVVPVDFLVTFTGCLLSPCRPSRLVGSPHRMVFSSPVLHVLFMVPVTSCLLLK